MKTETETSLEEDIKSAMAEVEVLQPSTQERGEDGKFIAKSDTDDSITEVPPKVDEKVDEVPPKVDEAPKQEPLGGDPDKILSQDKAPAGWSPTARESWATLPENVRKEVLRREEDSAKGVRNLQEQMAPYTKFAETLEPFIKEAFDNKLDPGSYIGNVMQSERRLRSGTAEQRFTALVEIAESYDIPLRKLINDAMGQEVIPHPSVTKNQNSLPPEVEKELKEAREFRENFQNSAQTSQQAALIKEIDEFKKDKEFFEDVKEDMGALLEMGRATDLQDAYDKACKIHPDVSALIAERASKPSLTDKQKAAAQMKGTSSNSAEIGGNEFDDEDDLATTVRKAAALASGRV